MRNGSDNFSNDHGFEFVSYIYDELDRTARETFEAHLAACDECAMELASYSDARLSVIEWRREDFDHLETPAIVVPWASEKRTPEAEPAGAFSRFVEALVSLPMFAKAGMGLAAAALVVGVVYFVSTSPSGTPNIGTTKSHEQNTESVAVPENKSNFSDDEPLIAGNDTSTHEAKITSPGEHPRRHVVLAKFNVKHSPAHRSELATTTAAPNTINSKAPRLSSVDEEDDKSLRLADLFAEIGSSEE